MTFDASTLSPTRKPAANTVAASRTHVGQSGREPEPRPVTPIQMPARDHPDERGIEERHRREHVAVVEVPERRRRREEHDEVEVAQRQRPPKVAEPDEKRDAERAPDPRVVDLVAAERALDAAQHPPRHLWPRPRADNRAARVVDRPFDDLAGASCSRRSSPSTGAWSGRTSPRPRSPSSGSARATPRPSGSHWTIASACAFVSRAVLAAGTNGVWMRCPCES